MRASQEYFESIVEDRNKTTRRILRQLKKAGKTITAEKFKSLIRRETKSKK